MKAKNHSRVIVIICLIIATLAFVFGWSSIEGWVYSVWPYGVGMVANYNLPVITLEFLKIALIACIVSIACGVLLGILGFSKYGREFATMIEQTSMIVQSIPTMTVLVIGMAAFGIGLKAAIFALLLQSLLPTVFSTMAGLNNVSPNYVDVGRGMGMNSMQLLFKVQLPLALPVILSGVRTTVIICISAATLAFNTGAGGLGLLIANGASTYNSVFIFEGTIPICLIAITADQILREVEDRAYKV